MGIDSALERRNYCKDRKSPKIISTPHRHGSKVHTRDDKGKPMQRSFLLKNLGGDFTESSPGSSSSPSRRSTPSTLSRVTSNEELRRGTIYQSSESVREMKKLGVLKGTRKIQSFRNSDSSLTFTIIDSLSRPNPKEGSRLTKQKRSPLVSLNADRKSTSIGTNYILPSSPEFLDPPIRLPEDNSITHGQSDGFLEICLGSGDLADETFAPANDGNGLAERDTLLKFSKSASAKAVMPDPPCQSESDQSKVNSKARISPLRRMLGPALKSKSLRNQSVSMTETSGSKTIGLESIKRNKTLRKSFLQDFSKMTHITQCHGELNKKDPSSVTGTASSPVHLHGLLRLEHKNGMPFYEFSLNEQEDVLAAKTWRMDNALNWVYTFYSINCKRKSNSSGWLTKDRYKEFAMVGQMQVSCYLCSEMRNAGSLDNSTVMEFVLYDITQARKSFAVQDQPSKGNGDSNLSAPWVAVNLHPHLEVAAITIQVPFEKKENLKGKINNKKDDAISNSMSPGNVKVITTSGTHGLPSTKNGGPSPLLDRWQSGGGCDCGGWDMACPVAIFENTRVKNVADPAFMEHQRPLELYAQGAKEKVPALTIKIVEEGQYLVDFHAQLSTLQAFSICIALLHNAEVSMAVGQERCSQRLQCKSLKSLLQEEVRILVEAVAEEEKRKMAKKKEGIPPYLVFDRPFSPIGRV